VQTLYVISISTTRLVVMAHLAYVHRKSSVWMVCALLSSKIQLLRTIDRAIRKQIVSQMRIVLSINVSIGRICTTFCRLSLRNRPYWLKFDRITFLSTIYQCIEFLIGNNIKIYKFLFQLAAIKQDTDALSSPPKAWIILGIFTPSNLLANYDFPIVGNMSPYIFTQSRNIFHCFFTISINSFSLASNCSFFFNFSSLRICNYW
jgi:hypothetical protein